MLGCLENETGDSLHPGLFFPEMVAWWGSASLLPGPFVQGALPCDMEGSLSRLEGQFD